LSSNKIITLGELGIARASLETDLDTSRYEAEPLMTMESTEVIGTKIIIGFQKLRHRKGRGTRNMT